MQIEQDSDIRAAPFYDRGFVRVRVGDGKVFPPPFLMPFQIVGVHLVNVALVGSHLFELAVNVRIGRRWERAVVSEYRCFASLPRRLAISCVSSRFASMRRASSLTDRTMAVSMDSCRSRSSVNSCEPPSRGGRVKLVPAVHARLVRCPRWRLRGSG